MRSTLILTALVVLCTSASAQQVEQFQPVSGPVDQWTYVVATDTWLHQALPARFMNRAVGPDQVFVNQTFSGSFYTAASDGRVTIDSGNLAIRSVSLEDQINCVVIGYATTSLTPPSVVMHFWNTYGPGDGTGGLCTGWGFTTAPDVSLSITGLPPSPDGTPAAVRVAIDLQCSGLEFNLTQRGSSGTDPFFAPIFAYGYEFSDLITGPLISGPEGLDGSDLFERLNLDATFSCLFFGGVPFAGFDLELLANPRDVEALYGTGVNTLCLTTLDEAVRGSVSTWTVTGIPNDTDTVRILASAGLQSVLINGQELMIGPSFVLHHNRSILITHAGGVGTGSRTIPVPWPDGKIIYAQAISSTNGMTSGVNAMSNVLKYTK